MQVWKKINNFSNSLFGIIGRNQLLFLIIIIFANLYLKTLFISEPSIWLDEASQVFKSKMSLQGIIDYSINTPNGIIYTLLLKVWMKLFGMTEFSIRYLSLIIHLCSVVLLFFFSKRFFNLQTTIISLTLFTLSNINIYYAQEAGTSTLVVFLAIASFYSYFLLIEKATINRLLSYFMINILLLLSNLTPILIIPIQFFVLLFYYKYNTKGALYIVGGQLAIVSALAIWFFNSPWFGEIETVWFTKPTLQNVEWIYSYLMNSKSNLIILYLLFLISAITIASNIKSGACNWLKLLTIFLWSLLPVAVLFVASISNNPHCITQSIIFITPAFYLLIGYLISLIRFSNLIKLILFLLMVVIMSFSLELNKPKGEDWKGAMAQYNVLRDHRTATILCPVSQSPSFLYYYNPDELSQSEMEQKSFLTARNIFGINNTEQVKRMSFKRFTKIILIYSHEQSIDPNQEILGYLSSRLRLINEYRFYNVSIYLFDAAANPLEMDDLVIDYESDTIQKEIIECDYAHSGQKVTYISDKIEYSSTYEENLSGLADEGYSKISISGWVYFTDEQTNARFVVTIADADKTYFWEDMDIVKSGKTNNWNKVEISTEIPPNNNVDVILKVYIWNHGDTEVLFDDLTFSYQKQLPDKILQ